MAEMDIDERGPPSVTWFHGLYNPSARALLASSPVRPGQPARAGPSVRVIQTKCGQSVCSREYGWSMTGH